MLSTGNGTPQQCAANLLMMIRGECPYDRLRGLDGDITDAPVTGAFGLVAEDVGWTLKYYEPRADAQDTALLMEDVIKGKFRIGTSIAVGE